MTTPASAAPRTARDWARVRLTEQILELAREQLATEGATGLNLRAIARDLDMSSSAIYRYFASRDELLTALIIEAYNSLGAAVEAAEAKQPRDELAGRFRASCQAVRTWAIEHPHQYALIYGSPVPGYKAPVDTVAPATRVATVMTTILVEGFLSGRLRADLASAALPEAAVAAMAPIRTMLPPDFPPVLMQRGLLAFSGVFGAVSFELFGTFHNVIDERLKARRAFFDSLVDQWIVDVGLV